MAAGVTAMSDRQHDSKAQISPKKESVMHRNYRDLHEPIPPERRGYTIGVLVQSNASNRWRVLLDRSRATVDWLKSRGATDISDAPLTLEELFVALGRD